MPRLLVISPSDIDDIRKKNTQHILQTWDEGFFGHVCFCFPFGKLEHDEKEGMFRYLQYGWKTKSQRLNALRIVKVVQVVLLLGRLLWLPFWFKKERYTLVRATDPYYSALVGWYVAKVLKLPLVVSIHANYDKGAELGGSTFRLLGSRKLAKRLENFIYRRCDLILPIREHMRQDIVQTGVVPEEKVRVFPHGISFLDFDRTPVVDIYEKFSIPKEKRVISFAGRFSRENYIDEIIEIAEAVLQLRDDVVFVLAGEGNEWERISQSLRNASFSEGLRLPGFQTQETVVSIRKQSYLSLCLMAGYSLIEACAAGRPVIAYDIEWHGELVQEDVTGHLVQEHDVNEVKRRILELLDSPEKAERMGEEARKRAFSRHDLSQTSAVKRAIYGELIAARGSGT